MKPLVVFLNGIADDNTIKVKMVKKNAQFIFSSTGSSNLFGYLNTPEFESQHLMLDLNSASSFELPRLPQVIFNEISDTDSHGLSLDKAERLLANFGSDVIVMNPPSRIKKTSRDQISQLLQGIENVDMPQTVRFRASSPRDVLETIQNSGLHYPLIIREAGLHNGANMLLIEQESDVFKLYALPLDGREFYLIQFCDYQINGVYQKYRFMVINGKPFIRHVRHSDNWMIHFKTCQSFLSRRPEFVEYENQLMAQFEKGLQQQIQPMISAIYQRLGLDHFGIDCALNPNGRMLIFEANASMHCMSTSEKSSRYDQVIAKIRQQLIELILLKAQQARLQQTPAGLKQAGNTLG